MILLGIICYCQSTNNELFLFDNSESVYLPLINSVMLDDWPRWFAIPIMHVYTCIKAYSTLISLTSQRTINSVGLIYRRWWLILGRIEICWNGNWSSPLFLLVPFCHKSKSYDKPRYTFIIANGSRNSSYRRITSQRHAGSYSVSTRTVAERSSIIHSTNRFSFSDCHVLGRILKRAHSPPDQIRRNVDPSFNVALKERFLKHFQRISYVLESTASSMIDSVRAYSDVPFLRSNSTLKCFHFTQ